MFTLRRLRAVWWFVAIGVLVTVLFNIGIMFASYRSTQLTEQDKKLLEGRIETMHAELTATRRELADSYTQISLLKQENERLAKQVGGDSNVKEPPSMDLSNPLHKASYLHAYMQRQIYMSQHPNVCDPNRAYKCDLNQACGFACIFHYVIRCLAGAYAENKVAVVSSGPWRYSSKDWSHYFKPLSNCDEPTDVWGYHQKAEENFILNIPDSILTEVEKIHDDPRIWYYSQFAYYAFRFTDEVQSLYEQLKQEIGYQHPIVGIHVRRTDKIGTEAKFHAVEEYMDRVEAFYTLHYTHLKEGQRRVFVATDEPNVVEELRAKYPGYKFIHNSKASKTAGSGTRYTEDSLYGIIFDIKMLSEADLLVGTFSSQVSRLAFEIMNPRHVNAYPLGVTLMYDDHWYASETADGNWAPQWLDKFHGIYLPDDKYAEINDKLKRLARGYDKE